MNEKNFPAPPVSERDQDNWEAQERLRPKADAEMTRLQRIETIAKDVVRANENEDADGLAVAIQALAILLR